MAMIASRNATRDFTPNPMMVPLRVDGKDWNWNRQFGRFGLKGMDGLGMDLAQSRVEIAAGARPGSPAYEFYYGKDGYYSKQPGVVAAAAEATWNVELPSGPPPPMLYELMPCDNPMGECVAYNARVNQANLALQENARRKWDLTVCEHNAAVNPGTATDRDCSYYRSEVLVPAAPVGAKLAPAGCSGGECYAAHIGQSVTAAPMTPQQQASYIQNKANQTVPPKEQPGEVGKKTAAELAAEKLAAEKAAEEAAKKLAGGGGAEDGKIFGMDPIMLAVIVGAGLLLVMRK